jgi:predicted nucleotidyltransferase
MKDVKFDSFGDYIRRLRNAKKLPLRKVAAFLDVDPAILSKLERGIRKPRREIVIKLADFYKVDVNLLLTVWLSDKISYEIAGEPNPERIIQAAEQKIAYRRTIGRIRADWIKEIRIVLEEFPMVRRAWLFGSFARGDETSGSDIDILIDVPKEASFTLFDLAGIRERIKKQAGRKVDIVMERALRPSVKERIKQDMELIYEA